MGVLCVPGVLCDGCAVCCLVLGGTEENEEVYLPGDGQESRGVPAACGGRAVH